MRDYEDLFNTFLYSRGLKLTASRRIILDTVFALHEHFDAEQLHTRLKEARRVISLATVYRTLPLLVEAGLIQLSLRFSSRDVFEHIYGYPRHIHWLCSSCGGVQETGLEAIKPALARAADKLQFRLDEITVQVRGVCWKCQQSASDSQ